MKKTPAKAMMMNQAIVIKGEEETNIDKQYIYY